MDRRERFESEEEALRAALTGWQADMWTAMPGIVKSFNPSEKTCTVQPAIQAKVTSQLTGVGKWVDLPLLLDCPVVFPSGGGCTLTFPISEGDECLVVFGSRCIDAWWQAGGNSNLQALLRMHDLSDGFVFAGISSKPHVQKNISSVTTQLRTDDGLTFIELDPRTGAVNVAAAGDVSISAKKVAINSTVRIIGSLEVTGTITNNGVDIGSRHAHSGVFPGIANSGPVVGGASLPGVGGGDTGSGGSGGITSTYGGGI